MSGVGIGWRAEIAASLLAAPDLVDFVEVVAESCFASDPAAREAKAIAEIWPVALHGVKLSLGSAEGIDAARARKLGALARELKAPYVSEHAAFVRSGGIEIGHLTGTPFTRGALQVLAKNVGAARRHLPDVPFFLENAAWGFRFPDDEMREGEFHHRLVQATGVPLLLDVANVHANARNAGVDPWALLASYPLDAVGMVHVAGGITEDGFTYDSHAHAVDPEVVQMAHAVRRHARKAPLLLERDDDFPPFAELARELEVLRAGAPDPLGKWSNDHVGEEASLGGDVDALRTTQSELARALIEPATPRAPSGFDPAAIERTRQVLQRKRIDDALPLLPRLCRGATSAPALRHLALATLRPGDRSRTLPHGGVADALAIADAALGDARLRAAARADRLRLEARYVTTTSGQLQMRRGVFAKRVTLDDETVLWAYKGFGAGAEVRFVERARRKNEEGTR